MRWFSIFSYLVRLRLGSTCAVMTGALSLSSTSQLVHTNVDHVHVCSIALLSLSPSLPLSPGNPVLIPSEIVKGLRQGGARQDHPSLTVFGSGDPQPTVQNYSWFFNDQPLFINGDKVDGLDERYLSVNYDSVVLQRVIEPSVGGVYRSVVNTSAGEVNVTIVLNVECEWSNLSVCPTLI